VSDVRSVRVGHADREQVVHVLMQQYAEGRLTGAELEQRSTEARLARTYADLDRLVADLPVARPSSELLAATTTSNLALLGTHPDHRLVVSAGMSSHVRRGVWTVPQYLRVSAGMATVKLDFSQAICPHDVVDIAVSSGVGSVVLVLPDGWGANTDQITRGIGSVSNKVDTVPQRGKPLLVLHGNLVAGSLKVRHPGWSERRHLRQARDRAEPMEHRADLRGSAPSSSGTGMTTLGSGPQDAPIDWSDPHRRFR
jgi:Domain of unknown function (DUF1707)